MRTHDDMRKFIHDITVTVALGNYAFKFQIRTCFNKA